jgi:hypothetical protein
MNVLNYLEIESIDKTHFDGSSHPLKVKSLDYISMQICFMLPISDKIHRELIENIKQQST